MHALVLVYVQVLPVENEAGRHMVERGKLCERKNGRGVDPNRNWPIDWGVKEKDYDPQVRLDAGAIHPAATYLPAHDWVGDPPAPLLR